MDHLSEQYPTDQRKEKKHEPYFCKKRQGVLIQVIILKVEGKQSCSLILIWCSSELLLNCLKYPEILKMLFQIYKTVLELCYKSCDESGSRASSYVWNALATTTVKKRN